ncbi:MAG: heme biosynthesis protein HemY [Alphaproteobacteria bacterium]|nr:heme biosynthesis protein HemY [Alphaproteobacteria bacterium]
MLKVLWFLSRLALLLAAVVWLVKNPGHIEITWQGYLIETSVGVLAAAGAIFLSLWTLCVWLWRAFISVPHDYRRYQVARAREKGYRAVTEGLVAVAAGDGRAAERLSRRAEGLLPGAALTKLLTAQTALMNGNAPKARREFTALLEDESAAFFGVRGLLNDTLRQGDYREALELARKAEKLQPRRIWVVRTLFELETRNRDWAKAEKTLRKAEKLGIFDKNEARRHRQAIRVAQSDEMLAQDHEPAAFKFAQEAFEAGAGFPPAALRLAGFYERRGRRRAVLKTIESAWRAQPHPDLAALWMSLAPAPKKTRSIYDAGRGIYDWTKKLYDLRADHRDSERALGLAALQARMWREARQHLEAAGDYRALARLEREESGDEGRAREWLEMAADAAPDPRWVCESCGHAPADWRALCDHCLAFDKLEWVTPGAETHAPRPLLAGNPSDGDVIGPPPSLALNG